MLVTTKCELCKNFELQLSHVLNELSSVDLLSKEHNYMQSESTSDTSINKQCTQASYTHWKIPNHQKKFKNYGYNSSSTYSRNTKQR